jgi:hypothetical protein
MYVQRTNEQARREAVIKEHREKKAARIAEVLIAHGAEAQVLEHLDEDGRIAASRLAGCRVPSVDTWKAVIECVSRRQAMAAMDTGDPFDGLTP